MARDRNGRQDKPKPEMIQEVLDEKPDLSTRRVQAAVFERYGGEVTPREVSQARRKLRQALAAPPDEGPPPAEEPAPKPPRKRPARVKKKRAAPPVDAAAGANVTLPQLSAILAVAEQAGGLRRLGEAVRTVVLLREQVGDVDDRQLAAALDFLGRVTRKG
ncbi:MAG TPA: hypothetical protein VM533_16160 [Fimbriiglobus sp.]|jgi:hypothetical protein|nr:hypothetical protein [Fimbriiglobus sp.]